MVLTLSGTELSRARMASLLLAGPANPSLTPLDVVNHFLAMQAQDAPGAALSLGLRTGLGEAAVTEALQSREIVRTWPMRGTLHLIPSRDATWMLELMGTRALKAAASRRQIIGLPDEVAFKAADVLASLVADAGAPVTRSDCAKALVEAGIKGEQNWTYHLLWFASQLGHLAGGPPQGKEQTFVSLDSWAPEHRRPSTEEALGLIASAYVRGHGPVTDRELARWTGLGLGESRAGLATADALGEIVRVDTDAGTAWVTSAALEAATSATAMASPGGPTRLLPGFDEFMLGYSESERPVDPNHHARVVPGGNGVFKPTVIDEGSVVATWERKTMAKSVRVSVTPLAPLGADAQSRIQEATREIAGYVGTVIDARWAGEFAPF